MAASTAAGALASAAALARSWAVFWRALASCGPLSPAGLFALRFICLGLVALWFVALRLITLRHVASGHVAGGLGDVILRLSDGLGEIGIGLGIGGLSQFVLEVAESFIEGVFGFFQICDGFLFFGAGLGGGALIELAFGLILVVLGFV